MPFQCTGRWDENGLNQMDRRKLAMTLAGSGLALVAAGAGRIALQLATMGVLDGGFCGGVGILEHVAFMGTIATTNAPHCWGCPAVVLGSLLVLASVATGATAAVRPLRAFA